MSHVIPSRRTLIPNNGSDSDIRCIPMDDVKRWNRVHDGCSCCDPYYRVDLPVSVGPFPKDSDSGFLETVSGRGFAIFGRAHVDSAFQFGDLLQ